MPNVLVATSLWDTADLSTTFGTAFSTIQTDVMSGITTALPYGLAIAGVLLAVRLCVSFFRSVAH